MKVNRAIVSVHQGRPRPSVFGSQRDPLDARIRIDVGFPSGLPCDAMSTQMDARSECVPAEFSALVARGVGSGLHDEPRGVASLDPAP